MSEKEMDDALAEAAKVINAFTEVINVVVRRQRNEMSDELAMHEIKEIIAKENKS